MRIPLGETVHGWSRTMVVTIMVTTALLAVSPLASPAMAATQDEVSRVADELTTGGGSRKQGLNEQELRVVADELTQQNGGQPLERNTLELHLRLVDEIFKRQPSKTGERPSESQLRRVTADVAQRNLDRELRTPEDVTRVADALTLGGGTAKVGQFLNDHELLIVEDELVRQNGGQPLDPNDRENLLALADEIVKRQPSKIGTRPSESQLRDVAAQIAQSNAADRFADGGTDAASRVAAEAAAGGEAVTDDQPDAGGNVGVFTRVGRFFTGLFS